MKVLLVDDDKRYTQGLSEYLRKHDIDVVVSRDSIAAEKELSIADFDVVLLDVMLPGESGFEFLPALRRKTNVPVIVLSALGEEHERVTGLELGADDYVTKPFSAKELVARMRALHRRRDLKHQDLEFVLDDLQLYPRQYKVKVGDAYVELTAVECRILQLFLWSRDQAVTRETLYKQALLREEAPDDRSLDVHMSNLRRKLGPHPVKGSRIKAIRGLGYALTV